MTRIAYANEEGRVAVHDLATGVEQDLSARGRSGAQDDLQLVDNWPAWSPDGQRVAFVRLTAARGEVRGASVWVMGADGEASAEVYSAADAAPIYMAWAPDGSRIAILVQSGAALALRIVDARAPRTPMTVAQGNPLYFAWCADSRSIIAHIGSPGVSAPRMRLVLIRLSGGNATRETLARAPAVGFRAPAWSSRSNALTIAYERGDGAEIVVQQSPEGPARTIAETGPAPVFAWSPNGEHLAYATRGIGDAAESYTGVSIASGEADSPRKLTEELLLAFIWSQDSTRLVCCAGAISGRLIHTTVLDVTTGKSVDLGWVRPSRDFWFMLGHFDQYSASMPLVSSDSAYLALAASHAKESENGHVPTVRQILARPLTGESADIVVGRGRTACWAPKQDSVSD